MAKIVLYTKSGCPYCMRAKQLLNEKGEAFEEIDILVSPGRRSEMIERAGDRTSVPQIFINGKHVGGCDDLYALDEAGKLDELLTV